MGIRGTEIGIYVVLAVAWPERFPAFMFVPLAPAVILVSLHMAVFFSGAMDPSLAEGELPSAPGPVPEF
jgi:hypothetical protein